VCGGGGLDDEGEGVEERGAAVLAERGDTALLDVPAIDADDGESFFGEIPSPMRAASA